MALDGVGLILQGAPDSPGYSSKNAPVYGTRFASGDRDYNDLSQWWYLVQTDWSGGFKDTVSFADDAKFYYSSNIDARTRPSNLRLERQISQYYTSGVANGNGEILGLVNLSWASGSNGNFFITNDDNATTDNGTPVFNSDVNTHNFFAFKTYLWSIGTSVYITNATSFPDAGTSITAYINSVINGSVDEMNAYVIVGSTLYLFGISTTDYFFCVKTTVGAPASSADFTLVFEDLIRNNTGASLAGAAQLGDSIIVLVEGSPNWSLYSLDIATGVLLFLQDFSGSQLGIYQKGGRYVTPFNQSSLLITIVKEMTDGSTDGSGEIWKYDGTDLTRIYSNDRVKTAKAPTSDEAIGFLRSGCTVHRGNAYWGNLVYDGTHFYNFIKPYDDAIASVALPIGSDGDFLYMVDDEVVGSDDQVVIYAYDEDAENNFKPGTGGNAFLIFSQHDKLQSIDKLLNSVNIGFEQLASGQSIEIYYSTAPNPNPVLSDWTLLGTASYSVDGGTVTNKVLPFPVGTAPKRVWFRVNLKSGGSNTPTMNDFTLEYLPIPDYKKEWVINVDCADDLKRLDGALVETTARELKSRLEKMWWTKSALDFQDLDYASTLVNDATFDATETTITVDSTYDFPEQGRLRVDDEEILYTGKTPTTFTGCTRGARGTRAATHADNSVINNAYRVLVLNYSSKSPILNEDKDLEYIVGLSLREV